MEPSPAYEVVILGGGPAGSATALALRRLGVERVLVVEPRDHGAVRIGESIPPESRLLLQRLGVWEGFLAEGHEPCLGSCSSWGDDALGYNDFLFNPHGHGWHLDRRRFDAFLSRESALRGADLLGARFHGVERDPRGFVLRLVRGDGSPAPVRARFVVDATGSRSRLARALGRRQIHHDRLSCVAAFLPIPASTGFLRLTMLEAVEYGWWYAARLPDNRLAVAVASDPELVRGAGLHTRKGWLAHLRGTRHLSGEIGDPGLLDEEMLAQTAPSFVLDRCAGDGFLAVGDAASAYDPISSQGIYKALLDGLEAAPAIARALAGDPRGLDDHHAAVAARFADYWRNRAYFYGAEQRWPSAPFWQRRRHAKGDP